MPRAATKTTDETEPEAKPDEESATIGDVKKIAQEIVSEIKSVFGSGNEDDPETDDGGEGESETPEDLPSPRRVEVDTRSTVEKALGGLTINVNNSREEKAETKEPETVPGGKSWLTRFVGLG